MTNGINPGESFLKRPARMSDKEYRAAKIRVAKSGLLSFRTVRNHTICCLTEACEKLVDPKILWGEVRGEPASAANLSRASHPSLRRFLKGESRGEVAASGANLLAGMDESWGEPMGEPQIVEKSRPASDCGADKDSRGEDIRLIARAGANLNQIARWANTYTREIRAVQVIVRLDAVLRELKERGPCI